MQEMITDGHLDMKVLSELSRDELVAALKVLTEDYRAWIDEQGARVGADVVNHDVQAAAALTRCKEIEARLLEGIAILADTSDDNGLLPKKWSTF